ncbi:MAG: hypothetical protein QM762_27715 [Chryseolinea sp.]
MGAGVEHIQEKIRAFRKKYYLNIFLKGSLLSLSILVSYFILAAVLEYNLWLGPWVRFLIFFTFFAIAGYCSFRFLMEPIGYWLARRGLSEEQSAKVIGQYVPGVKDRLLNLIQLHANKKDSALAFASIEQKSTEFESVSFERYIDLSQNRQYLKYLLVPLFVVIAILVINHGILTQSTSRIMHFTQQYSPEAPFKFVVDQESLNAFYNENLVLKVRLDGDALPADAYLVKDDRRFKLDGGTGGEFTYTLDNIRESFAFQIEAAGFYSDAFEVTVASRPELNKFNVELNFPAYLHRKREALTNAGNLEVPEGTRVRWMLSTLNASKAHMQFSGEESLIDFQRVDEQGFSIEKVVKAPASYEIQLENNKSRNKERIAYFINVIKDEYPKIELNNFKDSILFKMVVLSGLLSDDYGINKLALHYSVKDENRKEIFERTQFIGVNKEQPQQSFFHPWKLDSLKLSPGSTLEYYLQVWDNDGVNGSKSTKTSTYSFAVPSEEHLVAEINSSQNKAQQKIDQSVGKANKLQQQVEQANQKLKGKQSLDWQDKKMLEDIIDQKENLDKMVNELKDQNQLLEQQKDAFTEQNERIKEKAEQIQKLMNELLDDETKKLFEELQKLLKENTDVSQIQKILDKLNQNTANLEKELERTLELFKQLQYDYKLDQAIQDLKEQLKEQEALLEETKAREKEEGEESKSDKKDSKSDKKKDAKGDKSEKGEKDKNAGDKKDDGKDQQNGKEDSGDQNQNGEQNQTKEENEKLAQEQQKLKEDFSKTMEEMKELEKLGEELDKNDAEIPSEDDSKEVQDEQEQSKEMLKQNSPSKSKAPQQKAIQKMQQMKEKMEGAQSAMSMEIDMENLESLRQILHGLVKLSFDQEAIMKNFSELSQNDPAFNSIAQRQLKLKDDANVLEDSLLALGKRDPFMGSVVTKEIGDLNDHLDKVIDANKERRRPQASGEMQMTMTSINNLALMLDDHFDMMMEMMANAQPSMGKSKKKGKNQSLSQMQQQLNQRIQDLKGSGKSGRELSEELAEMAAEQERIRRALQEMQEKMKEGGKMPGGDLPSKMEQTEMDLVNKQLTEQMMQRQQDIVTRLLEAEKSAREQDMDDERKGETAKDYDKEIPKAFEEYLRLKEKEVELLKTVPPKLYPYYKKEVSEYFKRTGDH